MSYKKYNLNGREMLNLDNHGMVDYNEYYMISNSSFKKREDIFKKFFAIQQANKLQNEPNISYSNQYDRFLEELKSTNPEMYNKKLSIYMEYIKELQDEEKKFSEDKQQLLSKGYPFDTELRKHGYFVVKINNDYFQLKRITEKNVKINIGDNLLPQNADISSYEIVPITFEELQEIKMRISKKEQSTSHHHR